MSDHFQMHLNEMCHSYEFVELIANNTMIMGSTQFHKYFQIFLGLTVEIVRIDR